MTLRLPWLDDDGVDFPPTSFALGPGSVAPGLLAAGGTLSPARLEAAYRHGIFPWYSPGEPLLWWSPDPRMVLPVAEFRLHRSLRKTIQRFIAHGRCEIRIDSAFDEVIESCAVTVRSGQPGTWIVPEMIAAYRRWHRAGAVHSVETWIEGRLAGGLYGVSLGGMFYGESMFARGTDASKIALAALVAFCRAHGIAWIDCQQDTAHLASLGARPVTRAAFEAHLSRVLMAPAPQRWTYDSALWSQLGLGRADAPAAHPPAAPAPTA